MITREKIEIYKSYHGDVDAFFHATKKQKKLMNDEDFFLIGNFLQDITIIKNGLSSKEFQEKVENELIKNCDTQETINELMKYIN